MDQLEFIYKRHSVRNFTDEPVKEADLQAIFKAATYAPSGKNRQNWHFVLVKNKEKSAKVRRIKAVSTCKQKTNRGTTMKIDSSTTQLGAPLVKDTRNHSASKTSQASNDKVQLSALSAQFSVSGDDQPFAYQFKAWSITKV